MYDSIFQLHIGYEFGSELKFRTKFNVKSRAVIFIKIKNQSISEK